jgi:hypothetical protein
VVLTLLNFKHRLLLMKSCQGSTRQNSKSTRAKIELILSPHNTKTESTMLMISQLVSIMDSISLLPMLQEVRVDLTNLVSKRSPQIQRSKKLATNSISTSVTRTNNHSINLSLRLTTILQLEATFLISLGNPRLIKLVLVLESLHLTSSQI